MTREEEDGKRNIADASGRVENLDRQSWRPLEF